MTQTTALVINALLMAGIIVTLAFVMHIPFRLELRRRHPNVAYVPGREDERELTRAA